MMAVTKGAAKDRLARSDWILAGFRALVDGGIETVRVEALARDLGATKGSFYWNFKDLQALHTAMLDAWEALAGHEITEGARDPALDGRAQVMRLADLVSVMPEAEAESGAVEPAIRDWGRSDALARAVVARVDRRRLEDLRGFLAGAGLDGDAADRGAEMFYAALIGLESLRMTTGTAMRAPLRAVAAAVLNGAA
jgi:AcrR family transcriptional regulator